MKHVPSKKAASECLDQIERVFGFDVAFATARFILTDTQGAYGALKMMGCTEDEFPGLITLKRRNDAVQPWVEANESRKALQDASDAAEWLRDIPAAV